MRRDPVRRHFDGLRKVELAGREKQPEAGDAAGIRLDAILPAAQGDLPGGGSFLERFDDQPLNPGEVVRTLRLPHESIGKRISGMARDEGVDSLLLPVPPAGVVSSGMRVELDFDSRRLERVEVGLHPRHRVQLVFLSVDHEERPVGQVLDE